MPMVVPRASLRPLGASSLSTLTLPPVERTTAPSSTSTPVSYQALVGSTLTVRLPAAMFRPRSMLARASPVL